MMLIYIKKISWPNILRNQRVCKLCDIAGNTKYFLFDGQKLRTHSDTISNDDA